MPDTIGNLINLQKLSFKNNKLSNIPLGILNLKNIMHIDETSYEINNLDSECPILIFSKLNNNIRNLPINIKEIWLKYNIKILV